MEPAQSSYNVQVSLESTRGFDGLQDGNHIRCSCSDGLESVDELLYAGALGQFDTARRTFTGFDGLFRYVSVLP